MRVAQVQTRHRVFLDAMGWQRSPLEYAAVVAEEVGELVSELRRVERDPVMVGKQLADIVLCVADLACYLDIDLEAAIASKIECNIQRIEEYRAMGKT